MSEHIIIQVEREAWFAAVNKTLGQVRGVIHVGANSGQERHIYAEYGLPVVWIEASPEAFARLEDNLHGFARQRGIRALVAEKDGEDCRFYLASNDQASSSIFLLDLHRVIWPDVTYTKSISLVTESLPSVLSRGGVVTTDFDLLVLDTQGSELLILCGAESIIRAFTFIQIEVADFSAYKGGCQLAEVSAFMQAHGFAETARRCFAGKHGVGHYYEMLFGKIL